MNTVTGKIVSFTPASVSKAVSIMSNFVAAENGASQAVTAYLRRAHDALLELVRLHEKLERKKQRKRKVESVAVSNTQEKLMSITKQGGKIKMEDGILENKLNREGSGDDLKEEKMVPGKKMKVPKEENHTRRYMKVNFCNVEDKSAFQSNLGEETERKNNHKKRKRDGVHDYSEDEGDIVEKNGYIGMEICEEEKHKKKSIREQNNVCDFKENGELKRELGGTKKERKKRTSGEIEPMVDDSEKRRGKKESTKYN